VSDDPGATLDRLNAALNSRDIEAFMNCFHEDYDSVQPAHPDRSFSGSAQVRENWSGTFKGVPDFQSKLLRVAVQGEVAWGEFRWKGSQPSGTLDMAGVIIAGVRQGRIAWARLYMEPVERGAGIEVAVREMRGD
jgi:ketosteroid isomerase-like protein